MFEHSRRLSEYEILVLDAIVSQSEAIGKRFTWAAPALVAVEFGAGGRCEPEEIASDAGVELLPYCSLLSNAVEFDGTGNRCGAVCWAASPTDATACDAFTRSKSSTCIAEARVAVAMRPPRAIRKHGVRWTLKSGGRNRWKSQIHNKNNQINPFIDTAEFTFI